MKKIVVFLQDHSSGKLVLSFFVLTMVVYMAMLLYTIPIVNSFAAEMKLFDLSPMGYSTSYAISLLETLGVNGRSKYLIVQLPIDFVYPALFAITYSLLLTWSFNKYLNKNSKLYYLVTIPIFVGFFDYLENVLIISMLKSYPNVSQVVVELSSLSTILKSISTSIFFVILILSFIYMFKYRLKTNRL
jgi:hypothetical protein